MALVRAFAVKDFRTNALSTSDATTPYNLGALSSGQSLYAALHLTAATLGTTARMLALTIQSASNSGFGTPATRATFTRSTAIGGEWATPAGGFSTEHKWWRASWTLSTAVTTGGAWKGLVSIGIR